MTARKPEEYLYTPLGETPVSSAMVTVMVVPDETQQPTSALASARA